MILHGIPQSPFKYIVQPKSAEPYSARVNPNNPNFKKPVLEFKDPASGAKWKGELWDLLQLKLHQLPDHMSRAMYGVSSLELKKRLEARYPEIRTTQEIEILQVKKL